MKQCEHCPWKVSTDPYDIPDRYDVEKHRALKNTIARPVDFRISESMHVMACHHSKPGSEMYCVGWLANQLGPGNNLALRMQVLAGHVAADYELDGDQHETLEDTLP